MAYHFFRLASDGILHRIATSRHDEKTDYNVSYMNRLRDIYAGARLDKTDGILAAIGGTIIETEARDLILKKLYDLAIHELNRYLNG